MNKKILFAFALLAAVSCNEKIQESHAPAHEGRLCELSVDVTPDAGSASRSLAAYTATKNYEMAVNDVQILIFDSAGDLAGFISSASATGNTITMAYGHKDVYAVVNGDDLSSVKTKTQLLQTSSSLGFSSTDPGVGLTMFGHAEVDVDSPTETVPVTVSRLAARVALVQLTNSLPGAYSSVTVNRMFLENVVANQNFAGNEAPSMWWNKEGRSDANPRNEANIINGTTHQATMDEFTYAQPASLTVDNADYTDFGGNPYLFYAYPNSSATDPSGYHSVFAAQKTALVLDVNIGARQYYYTVVLDSLESNKTYTVALTFSGLGSDDPGKPVTKAGLTANISVSGWGSGAIYDETI